MQNKHKNTWEKLEIFCIHICILPVQPGCVLIAPQELLLAYWGVYSLMALTRNRFYYNYLCFLLDTYHHNLGCKVEIYHLSVVMFQSSMSCILLYHSPGNCIEITNLKSISPSFKPIDFSIKFMMASAEAYYMLQPWVTACVLL